MTTHKNTPPMAKGAKLSSSSCSQQQNNTTWWSDTNCTEGELLSAAVLCDALAKVTNDTAKGLEATVRASPLQHSLRFPVVEYKPEYVLIETQQSLICAVRATNTQSMLDAIVGSTLPLTTPYEYRYGGARIHLPFWKKAQKLPLQLMFQKANKRKKILIFCGHSIGGSIAHIGFCELVYQQLSTGLRLELEKMDFEKKKKENPSASNTSNASATNVPMGGENATESPTRNGPTSSGTSALARLEEIWRKEGENTKQMPTVLSVGFGSPFIGSQELTLFLESCGLKSRMVTFVNEFDCIPGILNVAQSAAMLTKTTERFVTITKATRSLLNLLPTKMQACVSAATAATTSHPISNASSMYITMSLNILQSTFRQFRENDIVKEIDYQYVPNGTYIFLKKSTLAFQVLRDMESITKTLHDNDEASSLTGNSILQHLASAYVDSVAKRSTSVQINASMTYYERLNIPLNATEREIRVAYKALALRWHPDRWAQSNATQAEKDMAEQVFKLLAESYEVLSDPVARKKYDDHLSSAPSLAEEFVRQGTVKGMTLDEAISTFKDVIDQASGAFSKVSTRFSSSSSSSVVGQPVRNSAARASAQQSAKANSAFQINNHENLFAPDRVRISREDRIMYVQPDDIVPGDIAAPSATSSETSTASAATFRTASVVGGAVVMGASIAAVVSAWSQYSDSAKRHRQADVVRNMKGEHLTLLLEDYQTHHAKTVTKTKTKSKEPLETIEETKTETTTRLIQSDVVQSTETTVEETMEQREDKGAIVFLSTTTTSVQSETQVLVVGTTTNTIVKPEEDTETEFEDDALLDEFYDCVAEYEASTVEALAEEEFFDCVQVAQAMHLHFESDSPICNLTKFPPGSYVETLYGLGTVETYREANQDAVIRFENFNALGYIQISQLKRGATLLLTQKKSKMEEKRLVLAEKVIDRYELDPKENNSLRQIVQASKDGALDSAIRATGGVVLAKGMSASSSSLAGAAAAPLAIASILVDIGKEFYDYRQKQSERAALGVLSTASEQLLMKDFRLRAGHHVVSGTVAAAGASIGAYTMAFWTGAAMTGPVGVVAATGAAVVGGMLGFFAGSKVYRDYTNPYFTSHQAAKEHIDRLELGARILFSEYDPENKGVISKKDCLKIMKKLYEEAANVSDNGYEGAKEILENEKFKGPVTWQMFWDWVSTEAAKSLQKLEEKQAASHSTEESSGWLGSYLNSFAYGKPPELAKEYACMYPSVSNTLKYKTKSDSEALIHPKENVEEEAVDDGVDLVLRAQMDFLIAAGQLTDNDAFQLQRFLLSDQEELRESARMTILRLHEGYENQQQEQLQEKEGTNSTGIFISEGFTGSSTDESDNQAEHVTNDASPTSSNPEKTNASRRLSSTQQELDVFCSLMSTQGLAEYLTQQNIMADTQRPSHQQLHCLALAAAGEEETQ